MKSQCALQSYAVQCMHHYSESFLCIGKYDLFYYEKIYEKCLTYTVVKRVSNLQFHLAIGRVEYWENTDREFRRKVKLVEEIKIWSIFYSDNHSDYC